MLELTGEQLLAERSDLSPFLFHLTRDGSWASYQNFETLDGKTLHTLNAKSSLEAILQASKIEARAGYGFFYHMVPWRGANPQSNVRRDWLRAVCFTETPLDDVWLQVQKLPQRALQFRPYGLAFREDVIRAAGGNPLLYINSRDSAITAATKAIANSPSCAAMKPLLPLFESFGPPVHKARDVEIDFRWEREWRVPRDFSFQHQEVAFGLCPEAEIAHFEGIVGGAFPFVDPTGNTRMAKAILREFPGLGTIR